MSTSTDKRQRTILNKTVLAVAIIEPLMALPQIYEIYVNKSAGSVSLLSWGLYAFTAVVWLMYGIALEDKPLIITSVLNILAEITVVIAIIAY